jgi:hypothetical protein
MSTPPRPHSPPRTRGTSCAQAEQPERDCHSRRRPRTDKMSGLGMQHRTECAVTQPKLCPYGNEVSHKQSCRRRLWNRQGRVQGCKSVEVEPEMTMRDCEGRAQEMLLLRALNRAVICMVVEISVGFPFECCFTDGWMAHDRSAFAHAHDGVRHHHTHRCLCSDEFTSTSVSDIRERAQSRNGRTSNGKGNRCQRRCAKRSTNGRLFWNVPFTLTHASHADIYFLILWHQCNCRRSHVQGFFFFLQTCLKMLASHAMSKAYTSHIDLLSESASVVKLSSSVTELIQVISACARCRRRARRLISSLHEVRSLHSGCAQPLT